jgi:hypothetical protein
MSSVPWETAPMTAPTTSRPTGITILAVLGAIGGVFSIIGGIGLLGLGGAGVGGSSSGMVAVFGILLILLGIAQLALAYGFWTLQSWAWIVGVSVYILDIIVTIASYFLISDTNLVNVAVTIVINGIILYYLNTPAVRTAFGRA